MLSNYLLAQRAAAALCVAVGLVAPASAQTPSDRSEAAQAVQLPPPSLRQAVEAAWALSASARAAPYRTAEWQARAQAAQSWISGPPSLSLAHRTDRLQANGGQREYEAELEWPLWAPGVRPATQRQVAAEGAAYDHQQVLARLQLAGQVREAAFQLKLAEIDRRLSARKYSETQTLARDVARRVAAGDLPRIDQYAAEASSHQAAGALAHAAAARSRSQSQWFALTGLHNAPNAEEQASGPADHPAPRAAQALVDAAQARLGLARADQRDAPAVSIGLARERSAFGEASSTQLRVALRIPFGSDQRNAPRRAAALAELETARAEADIAARQTQADKDAAQAAIAAAREALTQAAQRSRLSGEVHTLIAKAFGLGESDLPTRLRAENEKFDAELALARAQLELDRAISQFNQAQGLLP